MPRRKAVAKKTSKSAPKSYLRFYRSVPVAFLLVTIVFLEIIIFFISKQSAVMSIAKTDDRNTRTSSALSRENNNLLPIVPVNTKMFAVSNGMDAGWVLGQPNFTTGMDLNDPNYGADQPPTASSMYFPEGIAFDPAQNTLFVADGANNRVLVYLNTAPGSGFNNRPADRVLGQANFVESAINSACGGGSSGFTNTCGLSRPSGIWFDVSTNRLWVADVNNYRVVGMDLPASHTLISNGAAWTYVLGQPNFVSSIINNPCGGGVGGNNTSTNSCGFDYPIGVSGSAGRLLVADNDNQRVLSFDTASITNGEAAVGVLGKTDFVTRGMQTTQSGMGLVCDVDFDPSKSRLYVSDCSNNRVMVWESFNPSGFVNGAPASKVLGQPDFVTAAANTVCGGGSSGSVNACGLWEPMGMSFDTANNRLLLSDGHNSRLLIFDDSTIDNGEAAVSVLGQPNLITGFDAYDTNPGNSSVSRSLMRGVDDVYYDAAADHIYAVDSFNHRVLVYGLYVGEEAVLLDGGVGTTDGNTISISSDNNQSFAVVFPDSTAPLSPNQAILIKVMDNVRDFPSITIEAELPAGQTKTVAIPWYDHDICIKDKPSASVGRGNSCVGGVRVGKNKFDQVGECSAWRAGETVCHVGNAIVITGLRNTSVFSMKEEVKVKEKDVKSDNVEESSEDIEKEGRRLPRRSGEN